jgi:hypothetical protein
MNPHALTFGVNGTGRCLYSKLIDLERLGDLHITRSSNIEFNNQTQQWEVKTLEGEVLFIHPSRSACLVWEHEHLPI